MAASGYTHSVAFEKLKATEEKIVDNLTSLQYLQTLDLFLWSALDPIHAELPHLFHNYVAQVVGAQTLKASTKFTSDDRQRLPVHLFNLVTDPVPKRANTHARAMSLNRGLLFGFLSLFLSQVQEYESLHQISDMDPIVRQSRIYQIERQLGLRTGASLYAVIQQVRYWTDKACWFKELITQKYTRLALNHARLMYRDIKHSVRLDDVVQIYLMTVSKAIDRCNARQGVLTTFILSWFKSARAEVAALARTQMDPSIEALHEQYGDSIDEVLGTVMPNLEGELIQHVAYISRQVDVHGYLRATLGIPEFVTNDQIKTLKRFTWNH